MSMIYLLPETAARIQAEDERKAKACEVAQREQSFAELLSDLSANAPVLTDPDSVAAVKSFCGVLARKDRRGSKIRRYTYNDVIRMVSKTLLGKMVEYEITPTNGIVLE